MSEQIANEEVLDTPEDLARAEVRACLTDLVELMAGRERFTLGDLEGLADSYLDRLNGIEVSDE